MASDTSRSAPRTKPTDVRRHEIMDAGLRVFVKRGVAGASIDEIVASAGVAKGTFYLYFASKEDLVSALRDHFVELFNERIRACEARVPADDWPARLDAIVQGSVVAYLDLRDVHDALFHSGDHHPHHREPHANAVIGGLSGFISEGARANAWCTTDPDLLAVLIYSALDGALDFAFAGDTKLDAARVIEALCTFTRRAIGIR